MEVLIHKDIDSLEKIMPNWDELKKEYREVTVFQEVGWLQNWWEYERKRNDIMPYIIEIRDKNKTIGIIPLYTVVETYARIPFKILKPIGTTNSDYLIPILSKNYCSELLMKKVFKKLYEDKKSWDCIDWGSIPENSAFDLTLNKKLMKNQSLMERKKTFVCPLLELDKDIETINLKMSKKFLKGIRYYERKLNREGLLKYYKVVAEEEIEPVMNKLFELHCERWNETKTPSFFRKEEEREFALNAAINLFKKNLLHLSYLSHNDEIAAVEFGMTDGTRRYLYLGTYNLKFRKYPIAHILLYEIILEACEKEYQFLDFLRGDESYKKRTGALEKYIVEYLVFNRSFRSLFYFGINKINKIKHFKLIMEKVSYYSNNYRIPKKRLIS
ncbi:GNAT family N-acetyltransferase [Bacillus sp. FJAT-49732]|uniref:GNAT family N-acetyltransferase n=1 Tax=Lederbergia citrisecunda TaxID=2833583 RepID=A0A942YIK8_9BACI|nr:GNAT family N-acetyltransferase [Lederbergia citrisecunda]MBS4198423.1 GNAT family N-acetyltransferase [Lederbergia citrisecunda]